MPRPTMASRSSSSTSSASCWSAISVARSARKVGVATLEGRFWRSRAAFAATAVTRPRSTSSPSDRVAGDLERLHAAVRVAVRLRLEAVERVQLQERALHERGVHAVAARARPGQRHRAQLLGARRRGGRRHACLLGAEAVARSQARDQHAPLAAAGRVLVRHRDLLQPALRLAQLDQPLKRGVVERIALEDAHHAGVRGGVLGRSPARTDGDLRHQRRQSIGACRPGPIHSIAFVACPRL